MAESQRGTPPINQKQKSSALDEEIGNEFLSSWKSMSVIEDDPLNFSFDTVPKGKKKTFNFEKLDMDFNLDGDFDKLSSFKMDMPDLDFSSPPQKPVKPKKRCEEESSSGNIQRKQDRFNFSFDFNELDGFNFESSLMKDDKDSNKTPDSKRVTPEQSQGQGSKLNMTEGNAGCDDSLDMQLPAGESVGISDVETLIGGQGDLNYINEGSASKSVSPENLVTSHGGGTSPGKTKIMSAEDTDQTKSILESSICKEQYAQQLKPDLPVQTVHPNDSNVDDVSDISEVKLKMKTCSLGTEERNVSSGVQIAVDQLGSILGSDVEKSPGNNSPPLHICGSDGNDGERYELGGDAALKHMNDSEPAETVEVDLDIKDISTKNDSRKIADDMKGVVENSSMSNHPVVPLGKERVVDTRLPGQEKGGILSMFCTKPKKTVSQLHQTSGTEFSSFGSKRDGSMCLRPSSDKGEGFNTNNAKNGSKLVGTTISAAKELTKSQPILLGSKNNVNNFGKIRGSSDYDDELDRSKGIENLQPRDKEVTKNELVLLGSEKNNRDHHISSLTEERSECKNVQSHVNPKLMLSSMESLRSSEIILTERNKLCHLKAGKKSSDLSSMTAARITGAGKALSSSICRSPVTCLGKFSQNTGAQGNTELRIERPVDTNKKTMSQALSLKRKRNEASTADSESLQPLKRLSVSASESSDSKVHLERVLDEQLDTNEVCIRRIWSGSNAKHITRDQPTSGLESPRGVNMMELEIPLAVDNDENVKKAEAYTKELEKISNMLKKKHEEAKEILVRALVSNNNLLMLKHPIYEEKISFTFVFAVINF